MMFLTASLRRRLGPGYRVEQVRYRYRGWNSPDLDALNDADRAVRRLGAESRTIILVGHSMGGRVAAHLAAAHDIAGIVALAPWWPAEDANLIPASCRLRVLHGTADSWTDPESSRRQTLSARARGVDADWAPMQGAGHFMVRDASGWHARAAELVADVHEHVCRSRS